VHRLPELVDLQRPDLVHVVVLKQLQQPEAVVVARGVQLGRKPEPQVVLNVQQLGPVYQAVYSAI
jgi:hypothetical protein